MYRRHDTAAERAYVETRDGFVAQGIGYDAAIVSLDLAVLYLLPQPGRACRGPRRFAANRPS